MKTTITTYEDMSQLPPNTIRQIAASEQRAYSLMPYGEGFICSKEGCGRVLSADETLGITDTRNGYRPFDQVMEEMGGVTPNCPDCESPTVEIFKPEIFAAFLVEMYRDHIRGAVLTDEEDKVRGTCIVQATDFRTAFDEINYKEKLDYTKIMEQARQTLQTNLQDNTSVILAKRVHVERPYRRYDDGSAFRHLVRDTFNLLTGDDKRICLSSVSNRGTILAPFLAMGYKVVEEDPDGMCVVAARHFSTVRDAFHLSDDEFQKKFGPRIAEINRNERIHHSEPSKPLYCKGAVVDALLAAHKQASSGLKPEILSPSF